MSLLVMPLLAASGVSSYSLKTNYTPTTSIETSTDYDEVWNNVVDFFATNNLPISVLEKDVTTTCFCMSVDNDIM